MGKVSSPIADYSDGAFSFGEDVYRDINVIATEFNGNIDSTNLEDASVGTDQIVDGALTAGKLSTPCAIQANLEFRSAFDGVTTWLHYPNHPGGNGGLIMRVYAGTSLSAGDSPKTVTYVMNGVDGSPTFTEIPTFLGAPIIYDWGSTGVAVTAMRVTSKTTSNVSIEYTYTGNGSVSVYFSLAGGI